MKRISKPAVLAALAILAISVPLLAHHGNASYENGKTITVKGTVTDWIWANPHCWLKFDAKDSKGTVQHWIVEASNPPDMTRRGWARTSFKPGDEVAVTMITAKNGGSIGRFSGPNSVVLANGQAFSSSDPPAPKP